MEPAELLQVSLTVLSAVVDWRMPDPQHLEILRCSHPEFDDIAEADDLACAVIDAEAPNLKRAGVSGQVTPPCAQAMSLNELGARYQCRPRGAPGLSGY